MGQTGCAAWSSPPRCRRTCCRPETTPEGPLTKTEATKMTAAPTADQDSFYDDFTTKFFSANGALVVTERQRQDAIALTKQASKAAALACMAAFGFTDFRNDLTKVSVPALIAHADADAVVPFERSGQRTHEALPGSDLQVIAGAPHGANVSHPAAWNRALIEFLAK